MTLKIYTKTGDELPEQLFGAHVMLLPEEEGALGMR